MSGLRIHGRGINQIISEIDVNMIDEIINFINKYLQGLGDMYSEKCACKQPSRSAFMAMKLCFLIGTM